MAADMESVSKQRQLLLLSGRKAGRLPQLQDVLSSGISQRTALLERLVRISNLFSRDRDIASSFLLTPRPHQPLLHDLPPAAAVQRTRLHVAGRRRRVLVLRLDARPHVPTAQRQTRVHAAAAATRRARDAQLSGDRGMTFFDKVCFR